ncbi:MAG: ZIP family metal transporter [Alistipes sp.]|nr:ZIP family metal transporter [Alistipes sp.]
MTTTLIILAPFVGTMIGAATVLFARHSVSSRIQSSLLGFAAGVMVAASVWSLIIPAIELSADMERMSWLPAAVGIILGMLFLLALDSLVPHQHISSDTPEGIKSSLGKRQMLMLAVTLHNIPEGMAVGAVIAGALAGDTGISVAAAIALAAGMAIQNIPEGAIISLPLRADGASRRRAFGYGALSGVVEPLSALVMILLFEHISPALPYLLSFSAGAMLYVVVEELIPETQQGKHSDTGTIAFAIGFVIMMILDVALGA